MTMRLTSIQQSDETPPWTPAGETFVQIDGAPAGVVATISVRVDDTAAWVPFMTFKPANTSECFQRLAQVPRIKVGFSGNKTGAQLVVSSGEV